jgi:hypothetical protein
MNGDCRDVEELLRTHFPHLNLNDSKIRERLARVLEERAQELREDDR